MEFNNNTVRLKQDETLWARQPVSTKEEKGEPVTLTHRTGSHFSSIVVKGCRAHNVSSCLGLMVH